MKKYVLLGLVGFLSIGCNGQKNETNNTESKVAKKEIVEQPKGSWQVNKEFDEDGNLIRFDSIYSWSSYTKLDNLSLSKRDSLMQSFKSKFFTDFSVFEDQGFDAVFSRDSLFSKHFFNDDFFKSDFGKDFMNLDKVRQEMMSRQKKFLEKYQSEFIKPEDEN